MPFRNGEPAGDLEGAGIDLDELIVHHTGREEVCAAGVDPRSVGHGARLDLDDLHHVGCVDHR